MKILLVDDEPDVLDLLQLLISLEFPDIQIFTALDGLGGLNIFNKNLDLDMIFCDYNMPKMNGGSFFSEVRKTHKDLDFVLVSSEDPKKHKQFENDSCFHHIDKPFSDKAIFNKIRQISSKKPSPAILEGEPKQQNFIPVNLDILLHLRKVNSSLYLKISKDKFIKVSHNDIEFKLEDKERFLKKNVDSLYVQKDEFNSFLNDFKKIVLSKMAWDKAQSQEKIDLLSNDLSLVQRATSVFGWTPEIVKFAQENISAVINILKTESTFNRLNELLKNKKNFKLTSHLIILSIMLTDVIKRLKWDSDKTIEKLTFSALLHDFLLDEDLFADKQTLLMANDFSSLKITPEGNRLYNHPLDAANLVLDWPLCPPDVDVIIRQHHEKPDGQGFPMELTAQKIAPLSAVFIMCEDLIYQNMINPDINLKSYFNGKRNFYGREPFKNIYPKIQEMLEQMK